ncbi:MAG: ATP-binding protein [Deltaproteobacteria bacterium]|nr:ATP-binding protein [Deltaproteobacteria bacterium]
MSKSKPNLTELQKDLDDLTKEGICADRRKLKEDMCSQFSDYREWIREYAVNAYDARAQHCWISGYEGDKTLNITVEDDGHGMDRKGLIDFNTVYRSVKKGNSAKAVGCHGIGKISVAAIPGQCGFSMTTSTGKECWHMKTGCLLDEKPIKLEQVKPVPPQGTRFEITFEKTNSIQEELSKLSDILERYLRYLPIKIGVFTLEGDDPKSPESARIIRTIYGQWSSQTERFGRMYSFQLDGKKYEVVLGLGPETHEIYQNRVLVSDSYNLLFFDLPSKLKIPHLKIRVDCPDFDLPFGRHCLRNEEVLGPLAKYLREHILTQYIGELFTVYMKGFQREFNFSPVEVQDMACALIKYDAQPNRIWCQLPIFSVRSQPRLSLVELRDVASEKGMLYLESEEDIGTDYSIFDAPVLSLKQPEGGLELLKRLFESKIVNLGLGDVVLEAPEGTAPDLGPLENRFKNFLGFHPDLIRRIGTHFEPDGSNSKTEGFNMTSADSELLNRLTQESSRAREDLASICWRVNYLVQRDGKRPCVTSRFIFKNNTVILNLNNSEVQSLVRLSDTAPALAGHYALAMCLAESGKILSYLTPEAREELILMDAMTRCGAEVFPENTKVSQGRMFNHRHWRDFMHNIDDTRQWLN